jgi:molybdopterin converting factor small subunit
MPGASVQEVLTALEEECPGMHDRLCDSAGRIHSYILMFVNGMQVSGPEATRTSIGDSDEIQLVPAVAGGGAGP